MSKRFLNKHAGQLATNNHMKTLLTILFYAVSALYAALAVFLIFFVPEHITFTLFIAKLVALFIGIGMLNLWYRIYLFCVAKRYIYRH